MGKKRNNKKRNRNDSAPRRAPVVDDAETLQGRFAGFIADVKSDVLGGAESRSVWGFLPVGLLIFVISTPAIFGPYGQKHGYTPDLHMAAYIQVGAMVTLSLFLLLLIFSKRTEIDVPRSPVLLPLALFYGWAMLSVLWADTKYEAVVDALDWSGAFLCGLLIVFLLREIKQLKLMLFFIMIAGLLMALLGIGQFLFGIDWVQQHVVPAATFSNKNMAGQYGVLTLPVAVMFFLRSKVRWKVWFFAVVMALIMTYIFYTRSRGAWVGASTAVITLVGLVVYMKIKHRYHFFGDMPVKRVAFAASLALFAGMSYLTPSMFGNEGKVVEASIGAKPASLRVRHGGETLRNNLGGFDRSADKRLTMWGNSIPMFKDHFLIGVGLGNWTVHHAAYQAYYKPDMLLMRNQYHANAHNDYVEILSELGVIGFGLFAWVIVSLLRIMRRLLLHHDEEYFVLAMPFIAAITGIAVNAVFSFPLKQPVPILMVLVYTAVFSNLYGKGVAGGRSYVLPLPPVFVRAAVFAAVILAAGGLFKMHYDWYHSEVYYRHAVISMKSHKYKEAYLAAKRAHELNPLRTNLLWTQATAMLQLGRKGFYKPAVEMLEKVDQARYYSSSTLLNLASAYHKVGRHRDAVDAVSRLAKVQPIGFPVRFQHGVLLVNAGRYEEAIKEFEVLLRHYYVQDKATLKALRKAETKLKRLRAENERGLQGQAKENNKLSGVWNREVRKRSQAQLKKDRSQREKIGKIIAQAKLAIQQRDKGTASGDAPSSASRPAS